MTAVLHGKPYVVGETVTVDVTRNLKTPQVAALVEALAEVKAKSVIVHTPTRDQSMGELELAVQHPAIGDCTAVALIEHDGAVALWNKAGGVAQKFTHGMAGPESDLVHRGTEEARRRVRLPLLARRRYRDGAVGARVRISPCARGARPTGVRRCDRARRCSSRTRPLQAGA